MAEEQDHDATAASSPSSEHGASNSNAPDAGAKSAKDRNCPFCGQAFTSSSLGRHLDLYIKPKNPKPADGVHDVDEIRRLRGGITRRQPRNSKGAQRGESAENNGKTAEPTPVPSPVMARERDSGPTPGLNNHNWQTTGVINNLPARAPSRSHADASATGQAQRVQEMRRENASGPRIPRPEPDVDATWKLQEQAEVGRAAEMALREILGSLQAAKRKIEPGPVYEDFDFFAQTFPGLCLNILPAPTTLYSHAPFPSAESWSLKPPGAQQSDVMTRMLNERCKELRKANPDHPTDGAWFKHSAHLSGAFENWRLMSDKDKQEAWSLEALRAFTTSRDANAKLQARLATAEQHATHLEAQYDRLSRCQLPREWLARTPSTIPISPSVARSLPTHENPDQAYDPDALLSKWRAVTRSVARPSRAPSASQPNYASSITGKPPYAESLYDSMIGQGALLGVNGPMPRGNHMMPQVPAPQTVSYETPPNPGTILDDDDAASRRAQDSPYSYPYPPPHAHVRAEGDDDEDAEEEEDVSNILDSSITNFVDRNALAKQKRFVQGSFSSNSASPGAGGGGAGGRDFHGRDLQGTFGKFRVNGGGAGGGAGSGDGSPRLNGNGKRPLPGEGSFDSGGHTVTSAGGRKVGRT